MSLRKSHTLTKAVEQDLLWELLEASPVAVELFDLDGTIHYVNKIAALRYAKSADELVGINIWSLYPAPQAAHRKTVVNQAINTGLPVQFTDQWEQQWVNVLISPIAGASGKIEKMVIYTQDITRQINAEERLKLVSLQLFTNQEDERRRIAQDLHDDIGQSMTALILHLKAIHSEIASGRREAGDQIPETIRIVEDMMRHIRQVLYELRPPSFGTMPFVKVLEGLCSSMSLYTGLRVIFSSQEQLPPMSNTQAITLYRLVQEGINNVLKHAKAESVWINLEYVDGEVSISLEDDGQGFEIGRRPNYGIGLDGLRERFLDLGGSFDIESAVGRGTRLYGSLPIVALST
ncbi:MAG TPA: histidine kinase [Anaerolineales bacterium]|nr:histidine kinase [Anaerolineales bacterium]